MILDSDGAYAQYIFHFFVPKFPLWLIMRSTSNWHLYYTVLLCHFLLLTWFCSIAQSLDPITVLVIYRPFLSNTLEVVACKNMLSWQAGVLGRRKVYSCTRIVVEKGSRLDVCFTSTLQSKLWPTPLFDLSRRLASTCASWRLPDVRSAVVV